MKDKLIEELVKRVSAWGKEQPGGLEQVIRESIERSKKDEEAFLVDIKQQIKEQENEK